MTRRELGAVLEVPEPEGHGSAVRCPDREAPDVRQARRVDRDHDAGLRLPGRLPQGRDEDRRDRDESDDEADADDRRPARAHAVGPAPVLPGAWTGTPA